MIRPHAIYAWKMEHVRRGGWGVDDGGYKLITDGRTTKHGTVFKNRKGLSCKRTFLEKGGRNYNIWKWGVYQGS